MHIRFAIHATGSPITLFDLMKFFLIKNKRHHSFDSVYFYEQGTKYINVVQCNAIKMFH